MIVDKARRVRAAWIFLVCAAGALALYAWMFGGFALVKSSAPFWSMPKGDMAIMTAGYEAFVGQPWSWPWTVVSGLSARPVSIVFTDSIPWLAILLKAIGLGGAVNVLGLFLLVSYVLQACSMALLLKALDVRAPVPLTFGCLLALAYPAWIARQFGHVALSGHWLIVLALALSVHSARKGLSAGVVAGFFALTVLAVGVHAYHLIPIGAAFGAALIAELLQGRWASLWRGAFGVLAIGVGVAASAIALGYGAGAGSTGGADALGFYSMNVAAPFWPQASTLAGHRWDGQWYGGVLDATGGQGFEGYQYLGAGVLLLIFAMTLDLGLRRSNWLDAGAIRRWSGLLAAAMALTLWAIGWEVYAGAARIVSLPRPSGAVAEIIGGFRAHGRFFWACGYLLLAVSVAWAARLPRRIGLPLLAVVFVLQVIDTSALRTGVRSTFSRPDERVLSEADAELIRGRPLVFYPTFHCSPSLRDLRALNQLHLMAIRSGAGSNTIGSARSSDPPCGPADVALSFDAKAGDDRVTVILTNEQPGGEFASVVKNRGDCRPFARGLLCGRKLQSVGPPSTRPEDRR